jgi:hypothetical protein
VARIEVQPVAKRAHLAAVRADLPQHPRLAERPLTGEEPVAQRADALRDRPVEAPDLVDAPLGDYLTLVRYHPHRKRR